MATQELKQSSGVRLLRLRGVLEKLSISEAGDSRDVCQCHTGRLSAAGEDFETLYHAHRSSLVASLRGRRLPVEDIEDIVQEAFLRLLFRAPSDLKTDGVRFWLLRVARNIAVDFRRSGWKTIASEMPVELAASEIPSKEFNPEEVYLRGEQARGLHRALGNLTERQRNAISLWLGGYKTKDIAETLATSTHNVEELIRRGLKRLERAYLANSEPA